MTEVKINDISYANSLPKNKDELSFSENTFFSNKKDSDYLYERLERTKKSISNIFNKRLYNASFL